ncbi:MAG: hypothetical protein GTO17_10560, partial [Candidatus Aminicenantes bacterium]|nr:hypothetical protein [Candidatus Aminicenantes bacterium]
IDYFISLFEPADFSAGILSSKKYDGMAVQVHRNGDKIKIWSEDGEDITDRLPQTIEALKKINGDDYIIAGELEEWVKGKHQPREAVAGYVHSKETPDDSDLVLNIFTCLYHDGKDLHKLTEAERQEILSKFGIPQSTWGIPDTKKKLNLVANLISNSPEMLRKHTNFVWNKVASEGNVAKKANSVYYLDGNSRDGWIKWHANALLFGRVIKRNETKVETVFNYDYGILPSKFKVDEKELVEIDGKKYVKVGTTFNTDEKKSKGDLIAIEFETFNLIEREQEPENIFEVSAWAPRYIYLENIKQSIPKEADTIEAVVSKAKRNRVFQKKTVTKEGETLYECKHFLFEDIDSCSNQQEWEQTAESLFSPETIPEEIIEELEIEKRDPVINFKEDIQEEKRPPSEYPKDFAIMVSHFRGKSAHLDFRRKQNGFLEGETILNQPEGLITEDVDTIAKGRKWNETLIKKGKFRPDMDPKEKAVMVAKAKQPLVWLNVREVSYEPGSVGATRFEPGVFITMDTGTAYPGVQRPYFKEFFLDMKHFKGRMVERLLGVSPEWEEKPKGPTQWQTWTNMEDQTPYILSKRQRKDKRDYTPKEGEKAISPEWEKEIKSEFQWWKSGLKPKERIKRLDLAFNDLIEKGKIKARPLEIKESALQEKKARFALRWHWWMGAKVVRGVPATDSRFELLIDSGKKALDRWDFSGEFYGDPTKQDSVSAVRKSMNIQTPNGEPFQEWLSWEGSIPAKDSKLRDVKVIKKLEGNKFLVRDRDKEEIETTE